MTDYEAIIHTIIDPIVDNPKNVMIRVLPGEREKDVTILIVSEDSDTARLIGRKGVVASALREIVGVAGKNENKHIRLKFESFEEDKTEEEAK